MSTADSESLADQKSPVEIEKLKAEKVKNEYEARNHKWLWPNVGQAIPAFVLVTFVVAWRTGVLDARKENLAAPTERLRMEKIRLEAIDAPEKAQSHGEKAKQTLTYLPVDLIDAVHQS